MSVPSRLKWLLPGQSLLPALTTRGNNIIQGSDALLFALSGGRIALPESLAPLRRHSSARDSGAAAAANDGSSEPSHSQSPSKPSPQLVNDRDPRTKQPRDPQDASQTRQPHQELDQQRPQHQQRQMPPYRRQLPNDLRARMRLLRASLAETRSVTAAGPLGEDIREVPGSAGGLGGGQRRATDSASSGSRRDHRASGGDGSGREDELHWRSLEHPQPRKDLRGGYPAAGAGSGTEPTGAATGVSAAAVEAAAATRPDAGTRIAIAASDTTATTAGADADAAGSWDGGGLGVLQPAVATGAAAAAADSAAAWQAIAGDAADAAVAHKAVLVPVGTNSGNAGVADAAGGLGGLAAKDGDAATAAAGTVGYLGAWDGDGAGGGGDSGPDGLAAPDRDADISRRIQEAGSLREAELLLADAGPWFRSYHCAALLGRLPELDLEGSNAGARSRQMIRVLTRGLHTEPRALSGPALARVVAAYAQLSYAPPEAVPQICSHLLSFNARKLRACQGADVADLAWALAALQLLYGDIHQAVRRPWFNAQLDSKARVVGLVRGGAGRPASIASASGAPPIGESGEGLVALEEGDGAAAGAAEAEEAGASGAERRRPAVEAGCLTELERAESMRDVKAGSAVATSDGSAVGQVQQRSRLRRRRSRADAREAAAGAAHPAEGLDVDGTDAPAAALAQATAGDGEDGGVGDSGSSSGVEGSALARWRGRRRGDGDGPRGSDLVWVVPGLMSRMWERLAVVAASRAAQGQMEGEHLAKVAWAYAKVGIRNPELFDRLSAATLKLLGPYLEKTAAAAAATAAPTRRGSSAATRAAAARAAAAAAALSQEPPPLDPTSATNLAWAAVHLRHHSPPLLAALAAAIVPYNRRYGNDQMATLARSYAEAGHYDGPLCTVFGMVASRRLRDLSASELTSLVASLAALGHRAEQLAAPGAGGLARALREKQSELSAEQVCDLMWACAHLGLDTPQGTAAPGAAVLGLSPFTAGNSTAAEGGRSRDRNSSYGSDSAAVALASCLRGRCDGLPPGYLVKALWALSLLSLRYHPRLLSQLVLELSAELAKHPPEAFGGPEVLARLYGAAHALAEAVPRALPLAAAGQAQSRGAAAVTKAGEMEEFTVQGTACEAKGSDDEADVDVGYELGASDVAGYSSSGHGADGAGGRYPGRSGGGVRHRRVSGSFGAGNQERERLFAVAGEAAVVGAEQRSGYCSVGWSSGGDGSVSGVPPGGAAVPGQRAETLAVSAPDAEPAGHALEGKPEGHPPESITSATGSSAPGLSNGEAAAEEGATPRASWSGDREGAVRNRPDDRRRRQHSRAYNPYVPMSDPNDASWSSVDWDSMRIEAPSARAAAAAAAAAPNATGHDDSSSDEGGGPMSSGVEPPLSRRRISAQLGGAAPDPFAPDIRRVYDEALGRELWEVVPRGLADADADPAARLLPAGLLAACQAAAVEWSEAEVQSRRQLEATEPEMWKLEVAMALRELTGQEPRPHWRTRHRNAVADLLLLPPADPAGGGGAISTNHGSVPPPPIAFLLLGQGEITRNPPFLPLGPARLRSALLEASGARVVVLPRFLWQLMGGSVDEQLCMLGNLLSTRG